MKRLIHLVLPIAIVVLLGMLPGRSQACPNCKEAYMEADGANVAANYNTSIMVMIGVPFAMLSGVAFAVRRKIQLARRGAAAAKSPLPESRNEARR